MDQKITWFQRLLIFANVTTWFQHFPLTLNGGCVPAQGWKSETHVLGVVLSQLQRRRCRLHVLWAELGAEEQLRIAQTWVVARSAAPDGKLIKPEMGQSGLWISLEQLKSQTEFPTWPAGTVQAWPTPTCSFSLSTRRVPFLYLHNV